MDSRSDIIETPYDNSVTLLYKYAIYYSLPTRYVRVIKTLDPLTGEVITKDTSLFEEVAHLLAIGEENIDIYSQLADNFKDLEEPERDIAMVIYAIRSNEGLSVARILTEVNNFYSQVKNVAQQYVSVDALAEAYTNWQERLELDLATDRATLDHINSIEAELDVLSARPQDLVLVSSLKIESTTVTYNPLYNGEPVTVDDGLELFDSAITSRYVPYIRYNDKLGRNYSKVFTGHYFEEEPDFNNTVLPLSSNKDTNIMSIRLWLGDPNDTGVTSIKHATDSSFTDVTYHIDTNNLVVKVELGTSVKGGSDLAKIRLAAAFPQLLLGIGKEEGTAAKFNVWNFSYDESLLLDAILLDPLFNGFLYVDEVSEAFPFKGKLSVHYQPLLTGQQEGKRKSKRTYISNYAAVSIIVEQQVMLIAQEGDYLDPRTDKVLPIEELPAGTQFLEIKVTSAASLAMLQKFVMIFRLLLTHYTNITPDLTKVYNDFLPQVLGIATIIEHQGKKARAKKRTTKRTARNKRTIPAIPLEQMSRIAQLHTIMGPAVSKTYARRCPKDQQPIIITNPAEEQNYSNQLVEDPVTGKMVPRQIMVYPKPGGWKFVCPDEGYPFPALKPNLDPRDKDTAPYNVCCAAKDQLNKEGSPTYDYNNNITSTLTTGVKTSHSSSRKLLAPGIQGILPTDVEIVLGEYSSQVVFRRYGIIYSPNALLHCACTATNNIGYNAIAIENITAREDYVKAMRQYLNDQIYVGLLRQELYDYTDKEIRALLLEPTVVLDPILYYRAIEELFNINIYIFTPGDGAENIRSTGEFVVPRFKFFHTRPNRLDRKTMIVLRNWGSEVNYLKYPHTELIMNSSDGELLFTEPMTTLCFNILSQLFPTLTISTNIVTNYNYVRYLATKKITVEAQYTEYGVVKFYNLLYRKSRFTMTVTKALPSTIPQTVTKVNLVKASTLVELFGQPVAIANNIEPEDPEKGLWFQILDKVDEGEYILVANIDIDVSNLPTRPNPFVTPDTIKYHTEVRINTYSYLDYLKLFKLKPVGQHIDTSGKLRALNLELPATVTDKRITVTTLAGQPENLPTTTEIYRVTIATALTIFGNDISAIALSPDDETIVTGFWYTVLDISYGIFVPLKHTRSTDYYQYPIGARDPLVTEAITSTKQRNVITGRLTTIKRTFQLIRHLVLWLYDIFVITMPPSATTFANLYLTVNKEPVTDSATFYDLSGLKYKLPVQGVVAQAIQALEPIAPTLFRNGKMVMYNQEFYNRIVQLLLQYNTLSRTNTQPARYITDFYNNEAYFLPVPYSKVFINDTDLNTWLQTLLYNNKDFSASRDKEVTEQRRINNFVPILTEIPIAKVKEIRNIYEPILFRDNTGKLYIIQNIIDGDKFKATTVAYHWVEYKSNLGYNPEYPTEVEVAKKVYAISLISKLEIVENTTNDDESHIKLLYYGSVTDYSKGEFKPYAALLELL